MGDFKPDAQLIQTLPSGVLNGIDNHRLVDRETDRFAQVKSLRPLFSDTRRRYAGVVTDIAFDYFLIKHWNTFASMSFDEFIELAYQGLGQTQDFMPARMQYVTSNMIEHDWLRSYATLDGVGRSIDMVSKRIRFTNNMAGAIEEVEQNYAEIERVFLLLFAHLKAVVEHAALES